MIRTAVIAALLAFFFLGSCTPSIRNDAALSTDTAFVFLTTNPAGNAEEFSAHMGSPPSALEKNDLAVLLVRELRLDEAETLFQEILKNDPPIPAVYLNLSRLYFLCETSAKPVMLSLAANRKINDAELKKTAESLFGQMRTSEAKDLLEAMEQENRSVLYAALTLGRYYLDRAEFASASEQYNRVIEMDPSSSEGLFSLGKIRFLAGDFNRAAQYLEQIQKAGKKDPEIALLLGESYYNLNQFAKAMDALKEAGSSRRVIVMRGRAMLGANFAANVMPLLQGRSEEEKKEILTEWYGTADIETIQAISKEFIFFY